VFSVRYVLRQKLQFSIEHGRQVYRVILWRKALRQNGALHIDCMHNIEQSGGRPVIEENNTQFALKMKTGTIIRPLFFRSCDRAS
jgi:hypothetical protein